MDRILRAEALFAAIAVLFGTCFAAVGQGYGDEGQVGSPLQIKYAGGTAEPYTVLVDSGSRYIVSQPYSWVRDETSRYSLLSYSINDGPYVEIPRKARGNFSIDVLAGASQTVTFRAVAQYPLSAGTDSEENLVILFSPPSPTSDNWFDLGSDIMITVSNREQPASPGIRQQFVSWSLDNSKRIIEGDATLSFTSSPIKVGAPHQVKFASKTQFYVDVITAYGTVVGEGWYDAESTASITVTNDDSPLIPHVFAGWEESSTKLSADNSHTFVVESPKSFTASWTADYSRLVGLAIASIAAAVAVLLIKKRSSKTEKQTSLMESTSSAYNFHQRAASSLPLLTLQHPREEPQQMGVISADNINYSKEIASYALQKSIEKLDALHSSALVSDARLPKIKEKLEQSFD